MKSGTFFESIIYYTRYDGDVLRLGSVEFPTASLNALLETRGIMIWENQGSFKLIPNSILCNLGIRYEAARSINALYPRVKSPNDLNNLYWGPINIIPPEIVRNLLSEESSQNKSATEPPGENQTHKP